MRNAILRNYINYLSRPKLSLGSAHVKYGAWPGPAQMMTWSSFRKRNIEFLWMSTLKQSSFRNKKPPMVFIVFLDLILVLRRSIDIYIKSLRSSIQKYFFSVSAGNRQIRLTCLYPCYHPVQIMWWFIWEVKIVLFAQNSFAISCVWQIEQYSPPKWIITWSELGGNQDVNALAESLYPT